MNPKLFVKGKGVWIFFKLENRVKKIENRHKKNASVQLRRFFIY